MRDHRSAARIRALTAILDHEGWQLPDDLDQHGGLANAHFASSSPPRARRFRIEQGRSIWYAAS
jgi:hypothetical protein